MSTLYELTENYRTLMVMMENDEIEEDVFNDTLEGVEGEFEIKADNYAKIMKEFEGQINTLKTEEKRLAARRKILESSIDRMKSYLYNCMLATGKTKFKTDLFSFAIQKNGGKAPVILDIKDTSELPDELVRIKEEADLEAIRELLDKNEGKCKYAHYGERGESLRIK